MNVRPLSVYETNRLEEHDPDYPRKVEFQVTEPQGKYANTVGDTNE